jgi:peptidoglycan-N-acetylglucosamine deacetylase
MHRIGTSFLFAARTAAGGVAMMTMATALLAAAPARAQQCPGNPDAIGTSRVLTLAPGEVTRVGRMQYPETLPLDDHEVVLTFDDGPSPRYSNPILDILASQCVKVTYFIIGSMAQAYPDVVRREYAAGHTIGTHSQNHPLRFGKLPIDRMRAEIDDGIANVGAALGDPTELAPFFRVPGLESSETLESELAARSLVVFSADAVADDWHRRITPAQIISRAISRLEARGRGILLLHDIHPATVAALPGLLEQLKAHGFRIVQVVPAAPGEIEMAAAWTAAGQDYLDDSGGGADWPSAAAGSTLDLAALPAPDVKSFALEDALAPKANSGDIEAGQQAADAGALSSPSESWPGGLLPALPASEPQLPAPSVQDIGLPVTVVRVAMPIEATANSDVTDSDAKVAPAEVKEPAAKIKISTRHNTLRRGRFQAHRHARAPTAGGKHA